MANRLLSQLTNELTSPTGNTIIGAVLDPTSSGELQPLKLSNLPISTAVQSALDGKAAAVHTHDDRYYTETESDTLLLGKSDVGHNHNDLYFTEAEVTGFLATKSDTGHIHDDRYYTESEIDALLAGFSALPDQTGHNGKFLKTNGTVASWETIPGGGDMLASVYDPTGVMDDAFDMANMVESATNKIFTATERTKLSGIAAGATANSADATLLARANHTGTQAISTVSGLQTALDAKADLVGGFVPTSQIPALAISSIQTAADETAMLALTTQQGDTIIRTDESKTYIHNGGTAGTMADFTEITTPGAVVSVNGQDGVVVLAKGDIGLGNVDNTADASKPISTATQTALDLKAPLASPTFTGTVSGITKAMVGLTNVDDTSDANKPVSTAQQTALDLKANDNAVVKLTGAQSVGGVKTFTDDPIIPDEAYGAGWDGSLEPATKNALYDKIETLGGGGGGGADLYLDAGWVSTVNSIDLYRVQTTGDGALSHNNEGRARISVNETTPNSAASYELQKIILENFKQSVYTKMWGAIEMYLAGNNTGNTVFHRFCSSSNAATAKTVNQIGLNMLRNGNTSGSVHTSVGTGSTEEAIAVSPWTSAQWNSYQHWSFYFDGTSIDFYQNGALITSHTVLPTAATGMKYNLFRHSTVGDSNVGVSFLAFHSIYGRP